MYENKITNDDSEYNYIEISNGCFKYPNDWLLINPEDAPDANYVFVIECRNSQKYSIPHYVYFSDKEVEHDYIVASCLNKYPEFQLVIDKQVDVLYEKGKPHIPRYIINQKEWLNAPTIGTFMIERTSEIKEIRQWNLSYQPPAGAEILDVTP